MDSSAIPKTVKRKKIVRRITTVKSARNVMVLSAEDKSNMFDMFDDTTEPVETLWEKSLNNGVANVCPSCNSELICEDNGFIGCSNGACRKLVSVMLDHSAEWKHYGAEDANASDPARCGISTNPLYDPTASLGCIIKNGYTSYSFQQCKKLANYSKNDEQNYAVDFQTITTYGQISGISKKIIDDAILFYKMIRDCDVSFRGNNRDGMLSASIYMSCDYNNCPRTPREISAIFYLDVSSTTKGCKMAMKLLEERQSLLDQSRATSGGTYAISMASIGGNKVGQQMNASNFIERYCSLLSIGKEHTKLCMFIAKIVQTNKWLDENVPSSIAAGIIYYVAHECNIPVSKKDIHTHCESSEVTINKCYNKLKELSADVKLIPACFIGTK